MTEALDLVAIGNAIVDVIAPAEDAFLQVQGLRKGAMTLIDDARAVQLYGAMKPGVEASGGSAGNTVAGVASLGGKAAFVGKVADDLLGEVFAHDIEAIGAVFTTPKLEGASTGRCLINVTPDAHRTMATFLGAASQLSAADVDEAEIGRAFAVYLEGYLFDPPPAREAFAKAAAAAHDAGRKVAMTLSDVFVVERWREELLGFLDHIDIVFANENELKALYQTEDFDSALNQLAARVGICAVTRSEHGSIVRAGRGISRGPRCSHRHGDRHHRRRRPVRRRLPLRPRPRQAARRLRRARRPVRLGSHRPLRPPPANLTGETREGTRAAL